MISGKIHKENLVLYIIQLKYIEVLNYIKVLPEKQDVISYQY